MVEKLKKLETVVHALTRKVLSLEEEMIKVKKNQEVIEVDEEKYIEFENVSNNHPFKHTSSPIIKDNDPEVKVKEKKDKLKKSEMKVQLPCTKCEYKATKETTLEKHMITKHSEHECKDCKKKLPNFMALLKHVAEHHRLEPVEVDKIEDDENIEDKDNTEKGESKLDECIS